MSGTRRDSKRVEAEALGTRRFNMRTASTRRERTCAMQLTFQPSRTTSHQSKLEVSVIMDLPDHTVTSKPIRAS